jgi:hypothetical protein
MLKILKRSLSIWAFSVTLAPVFIQQSSIAQQARAWGPGETPAQAAERVVTEEQTITVNGIDKEVKRGEVVNFESKKIDDGSAGSTSTLAFEKGKEIVIQNFMGITRVLRDGTMVLSDGTATTTDGITILPDGRELTKENQ